MLECVSSSPFSPHAQDLSHNNISSVRHLGLGGLVALRELSLAGNGIISLPADSFAGAAMIRRLDLR